MQAAKLMCPRRTLRASLKILCRRPEPGTPAAGRGHAHPPGKAESHERLGGSDMPARASRRVASPRVISIEDFRLMARRRVPKGVFDYLDGGAEGEVTLRENCRV